MIWDQSLDATGRGFPADDPAYLAEPGRTVVLLAEVLGTLHRLPIPGGAGVVTLDRRTAAEGIRARLADVSPDDRVGDPAYRHLGVEQLVASLDLGAQPERDASLVCTHGRPTLGHLRVADGVALGLADWSDAAVAPAARDVAVALRALVAVFGPGVAPAFAAAYPGTMPTVEQVDWWVLADVLDEHGRRVEEEG